MNQRLTEAPSWHALQAHYEKIKDIQLRQLFADDPSRGDRLAAEAAGLYLDYSKNRINDETVRLLVQLAKERGVADRRDAMFRGEKINITEDRAVLHVALRAPRGTQIKVDGVDVVPEVHAVLNKMAKSKFVTPCHEGQDVFARHLVHGFLFVGRDEQFLQGIAVADVGPVAALGLDRRQILVDRRRQSNPTSVGSHWRLRARDHPRFESLYFDSFASGGICDAREINDGLAVTLVLLTPLEVVRALGMVLILARDRHAIANHLSLDFNDRGKAPAVVGFDVFENVDAVGVLPSRLLKKEPTR